jgi:hypothetical protein
MRSSQAFNWLGLEKLYIGAPATTISASRKLVQRPVSGRHVGEMCARRVRVPAVTRTVFATIPPRVEYELTDLGKSLWQPVEAIGEWARRHQPNIAAAQRRYDKRTEQG